VGHHGDGEYEGVGDEDDGDMIPMMSSAMMMTMATISPLQEGISPADFCLPESFSLSGVFRPAEALVSISEPPLDLGFRG
jgi:hypothetical protein